MMTFFPSTQPISRRASSAAGRGNSVWGLGQPMRGSFPGGCALARRTEAKTVTTSAKHTAPAHRALPSGLRFIGSLLFQTQEAHLLFGTLPSTAISLNTLHSPRRRAVRRGRVYTGLGHARQP